MDAHAHTGLTDVLVQWKHAAGAERESLWHGQILPRLDDAFRAGGTGLVLWEHMTAQETATLFLPATLHTTLAHTPRFPLHPHWLERGSWDTCLAAAQGFAAHAPWHQHTQANDGWKGTTNDAGHVATALLQDTQPPHDRAARFLGRLFDAQMPIVSVLQTTLEVQLVGAVEDGNAAVIAPILDMDYARDLLAAIFPIKHNDRTTHPVCALPLFVACWEHGIERVGQHRAILMEGNTLCLEKVSAHQRLQAIAWARAAGWPHTADSNSCKALATLLGTARP